MFIDRFKNRPNMAFDNMNSPDQEFHLHVDPHGLDEYPVKYVHIYILLYGSIYIRLIKFLLL